MPAEETKKTETTETVDITSQNVSKLELKITYADSAAQEPLPPDFVKNLRNQLRDQLNELVSRDDIQSVAVSFHSEDN